VIGPAGVPHAYRNPSEDEELRIVSEIRPPLRFEIPFETYFGLARDGKTTKQGIPKNPLQLAVLAYETRGMFYFTRPLIPVQRGFLALFAVLASVGRLLGYKASYPEYSGAEKLLERRESERPSAATGSRMGGVVTATVLGVFFALLLLRRRSRSSRR
jgi:hypothetical protein